MNIIPTSELINTLVCPDAKKGKHSNIDTISWLNWMWKIENRAEADKLADEADHFGKLTNLHIHPDFQLPTFL